jgi:RNA polymerase sigma factor (sigma-70 family)
MRIIDLSKLSMIELISYVQKGEPNAFTVLTEVIKYRLRAIVHKLAHRAADEKDIKQETLIRLCHALVGGHYIEQEKLFQLIFDLAKKSAIDFYRKYRPFISNEELLAKLPAQEPDQYQQMKKRDRHNKLLEMISYLSPQQQTVVILRTQNEMSFEEIGKLLGIADSDASSIYTKAKKRLIEMHQAGYGNHSKNHEVRKIVSPAIRKRPSTYDITIRK